MESTLSDPPSGDAFSPISVFTPASESDAPNSPFSLVSRRDVEEIHFIDTPSPSEPSSSHNASSQSGSREERMGRPQDRIGTLADPSQATTSLRFDTSSCEDLSQMDHDSTKNLGTPLHLEIENALATTTPSILPTPCRTPTFEDWQAYRATLTRLYQTEGRSLKQTKEIMQNRYNFHATDRMYKQRIAEWNLRKNRKPRRISGGSQTSGTDIPEAENGRGLQSLIREDSGTSTSNSHGSGDKRLARVRSRANKSTSPGRDHGKYLETYLRSQSPNLNLTKFRTISQDLENVEILLDTVDHYFDRYFGGVSWKREYPNPPRFVMREMPVCVDVKRLLDADAIPNVVHPTSLFSRFHLAVALLQRQDMNANKVAFKFINQAYDILKDTLIQAHPRLLTSFLEQFYSVLYDSHPVLIPRLLNMSAECSRIVYGDRHPITRFCYMLPRFENKLDVILVVWQRLHDTFHEKLGVSHEEVIRSKLSMCGVLIERGNLNDAEEVLNFIIAHNDRSPTDYWTRAIRCRMGWLYVCQQRHKLAIEVLEDLLKRYKGNDGAEVVPIDAIYVVALSLLARSYRDCKEWAVAKDVLDDAYGVCVPIFGKEHGYSMAVLFELDQLEKEKADFMEL